MPQSLSRVLIHLVFSTKNRERVLTPAIQSELHPYLAGTLDNIQCPSLQVGGMEDHVHLLFGISRTRTMAEVMETVKTSSSKWLKSKDERLADFHWQSDMERSLSASRMRIRWWPTFATKRGTIRT